MFDLFLESVCSGMIKTGLEIQKTHGCKKKICVEPINVQNALC